MEGNVKPKDEKCWQTLRRSPSGAPITDVSSGHGVRSDAILSTLCLLKLNTVGKKKCSGSPAARRLRRVIDDFYQRRFFPRLPIVGFAGGWGMGEMIRGEREIEGEPGIKCV